MESPTVREPVDEALVKFKSPETVEELLAQPSIRDVNKKIEDVIKEVSAKVGENVKINAFSRLWA